MNTIIWIFHNVIPWVGVWFTVMTLIFLGAVIYRIFKKKLFDHYDVTEYAWEKDRIIIILLLPMLMVVVIGLIVEGISRIPSLLRKIRNILSRTKSTTN